MPLIDSNSLLCMLEVSTNSYSMYVSTWHKWIFYGWMHLILDVTCVWHSKLWLMNQFVILLNFNPTTLKVCILPFGGQYTCSRMSDKSFPTILHIRCFFLCWLCLIENIIFFFHDDVSIQDTISLINKTLIMMKEYPYFTFYPQEARW